MNINDLFVTIPETTLPGGLVVPAFQAGQYLTSRDASGNLTICRENTPWARINYHDARTAADRNGYHLIRESQALALAYQIAIQPTNWTGGAVGKGKLYQGMRKGNISAAQSGLYESTDDDERRWFDLPDGQRIFDAAGNAYTWTFDDIQGDDNGLVARAFEKNSPSIVIPYPEENKGQGWTPRAGADWSGSALCRGGCWSSGVDAGVFRLSSDWPGGERGYVGFRCTKSL